MNLTPGQIMDGMAAKNRMLTQKNEEYAKLSEKWAQAKRAYRVAYSSKITELKIAGQSVTLIPDLAKGDKAVATLRFEFDISEGVMKACQGSIYDIRSSIDTYRSILSYMKLEHKNAGSSLTFYGKKNMVVLP